MIGKEINKKEEIELNFYIIGQSIDDDVHNRLVITELLGCLTKKTTVYNNTEVF